VRKDEAAVVTKGAPEIAAAGKENHGELPLPVDKARLYEPFDGKIRQIEQC
jgi:hypothetical protein